MEEKPESNYKWGRVIKRKELGNETDTLDQVASIAFLFISNTDKNERGKLLNKYGYGHGVDEVKYHDTGRKELPGIYFSLWKGRYSIVVRDYEDEQKRVLDVTAWQEDTRNKTAVSSTSGIQDALDADNESRKYDLAEARRFVRDTRKILLEIMANSN